MSVAVALVTALPAPGLVARQAATPEILLLDNYSLAAGAWRSSVWNGRMQQELEKAGAKGFRLVPLPGAWWPEVTAVLEMTADARPIEYRLLSTIRTTTMRKEMSEASAAGFRFAGVLGVAPLTIAMARAKGVAASAYESTLLATERLQTLEDELRGEVAKGFSVAGVTGYGAEFIAFLERPARSAESDARDYTVLRTFNTGTLHRELQNAANRGYRIPRQQGSWGSAALLERAPPDAEPVEYLVLAARKTGTIQKELDEASADGYRFASFLGADREILTVMQRPKIAATRTHEQILLSTTKFTTMRRELLEQFANGYRLVGQSMYHPPDVLLWRPALEYVAILERSVR